MSSLSGLHLIITRPMLQAKNWQRQLSAMGASTHLMPILEIVPVAEPEQQARIRKQIMALADYDIAIFVSQNAVHQAMEWIDQLWPQFPQLDYFAVGSATAKAARDWGLQVTEGRDAMNSEVLLALPELEQVAAKKIVIFRGVGGRPMLGEQLRKRKAQVDYCELYHRRLPQVAARQWRELEIDEPELTVLSAHSGESLENLDDVLNQTQRGEVKKLSLLVPGERVAKSARKLGFDQVIVAENATDQAMLRALREWYGAKQAAASRL